MSKKLLAIFMALIMVLGSTVMAGAEDISTELVPLHYERIKNSVLVNVPDSETYVYEYEETDSGTILVGRKYEKTGDIVVQMVAPYMLNDAGDGINIFSYYDQNPQALPAGDAELNYSITQNNVTLVVTGRYSTALAYNMGVNYYRPTYLTASYTVGSGTSISASYLSGTYVACGDLYNVTTAECKTINYSVSRSISQSSPSANVVYQSSSMGIVAPNGLILNGLYENDHGASCEATLTYTYNGSSRTLYTGMQMVFRP